MKNKHNSLSVVRSNTPRPVELHGEVQAAPLPASVVEDEATEVLSEFIWLFEYNPSMDESLLNTPDRLNGLALLYGPAVLKGYQLAYRAGSRLNWQELVTILPTDKAEAEVRGVLYRIPRRCSEGRDEEPSLLDRTHNATGPDCMYEPLHIIVREVHRGREVASLAYAANARARGQFLPGDQKRPGAISMVEPQTEPLTATRVKSPVHQASFGRSQPSRGPWLLIFAVYLACLLPLLLALAVVQGLGIWSNIFTARFTPLGVPWFVLLYGLLGGCLSSIVSLRHRQPFQIPNFVAVVWFLRPLVGAVLGGLVFLLLNTGFFALNGTDNPHSQAIFSLVGALAGLCEGLIFTRRD